MTIVISPPPSVPSTPWTYGASVPYASAGIAQDLTIALSPGNDSTTAAIFLSPSPISAGTQPDHASPPPGAHLVAVTFNGHATVTVPDQETRANGHILVARWGGGHDRGNGGGDGSEERDGDRDVHPERVLVRRHLVLHDERHLR